MSRERMFAVVVLAALGAAAMACSGGGGSNSNDAAGKPSKHQSSNNDDPGTSSEPGDTSMPSSTNPPPPPATDAGATDSGMTAPPPGGPMCKALPSCTSTQTLAAIAGDSGGESKATAAGSQWFTIRVQEQSTSTQAISIDAVLTPPPSGADYELHVYQDDCKTELAAPVTNDDGTIEVYSTWDDRNFLDDGKNLTIEVRYKSGACDNAQKWNLDVLGGL